MAYGSKACWHLVSVTAGIAVLANMSAVTARQVAGPPTFVAVSVDDVGAYREPAIANPTVHFPRVSLRNLIEIAYKVTGARTEGGPSWMDDILWDVSARAASKVPYSTVRLMLRAMLEDRFQLRTRFFSRPTSEVVLSFGSRPRGGGIRPTTEHIDCSPFFLDREPLINAPHNKQGVPLCGPSGAERRPSQTTERFRSVPLAAFAHDLELLIQKVVVLSQPSTELFDIDLVIPPGFQAPDVDAILSAVEHQLGASVEIRTQPVDVLTIQSASRPTIGR